RTAGASGARPSAASPRTRSATASGLARDVGGTPTAPSGVRPDERRRRRPRPQADRQPPRDQSDTWWRWTQKLPTKASAASSSFTRLEQLDPLVGGDLDDIGSVVHVDRLL